jgi:hypothetical protein
MKAAVLLLLLLSGDAIPEINSKIKVYLDQVMGTRVDSGECWDLAAAALDFSGGYLDRSNQKSIYIFGKEIFPSRESVYPGDIIQFEKVVLKYQEGNRIYTESMPHHTAIVYEVLAPGQFVIAHQNTRTHGRKVGLTKLNLEHLTGGKLIFYRPISASEN